MSVNVFQFRVVREFRAAAAGRFDDDLHVAVFRKGRQVDEIRHDGCPSNFDERAAQKEFAEPMYQNKRFT